MSRFSFSYAYFIYPYGINILYTRLTPDTIRGTWRSFILSVKKFSNEYHRILFFTLNNNFMKNWVYLRENN